jgi:hypothetical protein
MGPLLVFIIGEKLRKNTKILSLLLPPHLPKEKSYNTEYVGCLSWPFLCGDDPAHMADSVLLYFGHV